MLLLALALTSGGCEKLPLLQVQTGFTLASGAHFAEEATLFLFYRLEADQGLGPESVVELSYRTDSEEVGWTPLSALPMVHTHLPVDCGSTCRTGSASVEVHEVPRDVRLRLRYHRDGALALETEVALDTIGEGPAPAHRSLVVYGVLDESNRRVQWRSRHQFPNVRNLEAEALGLRRWFRVEERRAGLVEWDTASNDYGYAFAAACPEELQPLGGNAIETEDRAAFDAFELPLTTSSSPAVCARTTVGDARGGFVAAAVARKNPEVAPAFTTLRSPIRRNTPLGFVVRPCARTISDTHLAMQRQRLLLEGEGTEELCADAWWGADFVPGLVARLRARIDEARPRGDDMVLTIVLHHDDATGELAAAVEEALEQVLVPERDALSPRVSGAWVFDSRGHALEREALRPLALWCPAAVGDDLELGSTVSLRDCPLQADVPDVQLGPFRFNALPILPTRAQYLTFIDRYGEANAGKMARVSLLSPERAAVSRTLPLGDFGAVTFFNHEIITASPQHAFSFCLPPGTSEEEARARTLVQHVVFVAPDAPDIAGPLPLSSLPQLHEASPQRRYALGIAWEFPFLVRLEYETYFAGQVSALSISVPFGVKSEAEAYPGAWIWERGEFDLSQRLLRCSRFCEHPTFRNDGAYEVRRPFRGEYLDTCYQPRYPGPEEGGFPYDP